jgi:hypothetical protein
LGGLLPCPFRKDFLQALAIEGKLGACVLSHLFRNFEPVHGHEASITPSPPFRKERERRGLPEAFVNDEGVVVKGCGVE